MSSELQLGEISWERMIRAVEKVKERLQRTVQVLEAAGIPYAVIDGNAVAAWVSRIDEAAVRNTRDVDVLIRREDLPRMTVAMEQAGFLYRHAASIDMFLDGPTASARDAVHVIFANEKVRAEYAAPTPDVNDVDAAGTFRVIGLESLARMKLTSFRRKDQMHLIDLIDLGLIDETWPDRFAGELKDRLQLLLDDPEG